MAQTGFTPISIYYSSTASNVPTAGNLVAGELAINTADGRLFYKDSSGVVQTIASKGAGTVGGSNTQIQYNSSGSLAGSANFVFDGNNASLGTSTFNPLSNGGTNKTFAVSGGSGYGSLSLVTSATSDTSIVGALNFGSSGASTNPTTAAINTYLSGSGATNASGYMSFFTRNGTDISERMRILSTGNILSLSGGSTTATGTGISFPATQSASSDANTLDDYEEGTFTPVLSADSGATSGGGIITGRYTKIGRLVYVNVTINGVSKNTLSGNMRVSNMPFVNADANANGIIRFDWGAVVTGYNVCVPEIPSGATAFDLQLFNLYQFVGQLQASNCGSTISVYSLTACYSV